MGLETVEEMLNNNQAAHSWYKKWPGKEKGSSNKRNESSGVLFDGK